MQNTVQLCCTETEMWFVGSLSIFLSSHQRISWNWRSRQVSSYLRNLTFTLLPCKRPLFSFCLLEWGGETDALPEPRQAFDVAKSRTSWLVNLVFSCQSGFPSSIIGLLIELNPLYQANGYIRPGFRTVSQQTAQWMLNKDLTRFIYSLSRERQNRASKRKTASIALLCRTNLSEKALLMTCFTSF